MENIRPLRTEADYDWALGEIEGYFEQEPEPGTPEADRFDVLADLIEAYEARHWPIEPADPVDAILFKMETAGLTQVELGQLLGSQARASDVLKRKRPLTLRMIHRLHAEWQIPAESLIRPYHLEGDRAKMERHD